MGEDWRGLEGSDWEQSAWVWCFHCEVVGLRSEWERLGECPGCGAGVFDGYPWLEDERPRAMHSEYPGVPVVGGYYPMWSCEEGRVVGEKR